MEKGGVCRPCVYHGGLLVTIYVLPKMKKLPQRSSKGRRVLWRRQNQLWFRIPLTKTNSEHHFCPTEIGGLTEP